MGLSTVLQPTYFSGEQNQHFHAMLFLTLAWRGVSFYKNTVDMRILYYKYNIHTDV